jgi:rSAM/selenodomain-associated transferase 1
MKKSDCRIIVLTKAPILGEVKTRLLSSMDAQTVTALHEQLVLHSLNTATESRVGPVDLWCSPSKEHPFFLQCAEKFGLELHQQTGRDFGRRMAHAFDETLKRARMALLMGTDCPSLTPEDLKEAKKVLKQGAPVVISPAEDGGYVLIGLRQYEPELFKGVAWGTRSVLKETRDRLRKLGWKWYELSERWDVDRPEDVERLRREGLMEWN